jgi:KaiC/GvpD/RAD55 family RecA-like ATPase
LFEKGIPRSTNVLVSGGPGTGKTIFCLQTLYNMARNGHDCLYVTFEESPSKLKHHMENFGWIPTKVEGGGTQFKMDIERSGKSGSFIIRKLDPFKISRSVEALLAKAAGQLRIDVEGIPELFPKGFKPYMIALDSVSALESAFIGKPESYRIYIEQLFRLFEEIGANTLLITETEEGATTWSRTGVEEFLADGVFVLYNFKFEYNRVQAIEILKMRGAKHEKKIIPMKITDRGIIVYPSEKIYEYKGEAAR